MTVTINGKEIEVSGKIRNVIMDRNRLGYMETASAMSLDEEEFSYTVKDKINSITAEYNEIESVKEYDNAIYIYAHDAYNGKKHQIVLFK